MTYQVTPESLYIDVVHGAFFSRAVFTACELKLPDCLEGEMTVTELAGKAGTDIDDTERLMKFLSLSGVFTYVCESTYSHSPASLLLRADHPHSHRHSFLLHSRVISQAISSWPTSITDGHTIPFQSSFHTNQSYWEFLCGNSELKTCFDKAMTVHTEREVGSIGAEYNWEQYAGKEIVDVGGGFGQLLAVIMRKEPTIRGEIFDLPETAAEARTYWDTNYADLKGRVTFSGGSFFDEIPSNGDIYLLKHILHDWNNRDSLRILTNLASSMRRRHLSRPTLPPQALILELLYNMPPSNPNIGDFDLIMFTLFRGKERSSVEFQSLFSQSGLELVSTTSLSTLNILTIQLAKS